MILLLTGLVACQSGIFGQQDVPATFRPAINLFTDRTLYVTGEQIRFSACPDRPEMNGDRVLYAELITPGAASLNGGKFRIDETGSHGCLEIPADLLTGNYYFRAYTRSMRDEGPYVYGYVRLKIINPSNPEILAGSGSESLWQLVPAEKSPHGQEDLLKISTDREEYHSGENIPISIRTGLADASLCVSVVPEASFSDERLIPPARDAISFQREQVPESRGISLTGRVRDRVTGEEVPMATVNLSIINDRDFMASRTDSSGRFYFSLPWKNGTGDLFLSPGDQASEGLDILVDNDFCTVPVELPAPVFTLTGKEKEAAYNMAVNKQVDGYFHAGDSLVAGQQNEISRVMPFYGDPSEVLLFDKYIQLPSLEEYFSELPVSVKVRKRQGQKYFKFYEAKGEMEIYDPLVLIDGAAVSDIEGILAVSTQAISRIELVNAPYMKGDMIYGGIVSIISKKGDFAGIDLPTDGIFISYQFLSDRAGCPIRPDIPDTRNTLLWVPYLKTRPGEETSFSFPAPDTPGNYIVTVKGHDAKGGSVLVEKSIHVAK